VTGGARRIGAAICRRLHASGATIIIHYRDSATEAERLAAELNAQRAKSCSLAHGDLLQTEALPVLVEHASRAYGRLDALINNASSIAPTPLGAITEESWRDLIGTNLKAPLFLAQAAAPLLERTSGCIVNLTDIHAERPLRGHLVYNIAKGGLTALTRSLALELGPAIRVNGVAPGPILWPEHDDHFDAQERERILRSTPLRRMGSPDDVAGAVHYLVYDAPYVTGQIIAVEGGRTLWM
jgi:pteridine reductase